MARAANVPGTGWLLNAEDPWSAGDISTLADLAARLPASYRAEAEPVSFDVEDARPFVGGEGHTLARVSRVSRRVTLYTRGLAEHVAEAAAELGIPDAPEAAVLAAGHLLQRAVVHELTHLLDRRARLSASPEWRALSGWSWQSYFPTPFPRAASGDFAAPWGARSPAEDLATFAEVYFVPPALGPVAAEEAPRCRFPSKYGFFQARLDPHPDPSPDVRCSGPEHAGLATERVGEVHILWASPTLSSLASVGGHLLIAVELLDGETARWDTFAMLADSADTPVGSPHFALLGAAGGFPGQVVRAPYETTRLRYVEAENRDLLRFRWSLTPEEKARVLARLDDLSLHWRRPYLFFQQNCSALILELADVVESDALRMPPVVPPELVLAELSRRGRITPVSPDPTRDLAPSTRARLLADARAEATRAVCGEATPGASAVRVEGRDAAYAAILARAQALDTEACWTEVARILALVEPLERASGHSGPGREAAVAATRERLPIEARVAAQQEARRIVSEAWADGEPRNATNLHTPYVPLTLGVRVEGPDARGPAPAVFLRREAIGLDRAEPRVFAPARGVDLRALATEVAVRPLPSPEVMVAHDLLAIAVYDEPLVPAPARGVRLDLLSVRVDTGIAHAWVRWAGAAGGLSFARAENGYVEAWLGAEIRTAVDASGDVPRAATWFAAPARLHGVAHLGRGARIALEGEVAGLPALDTDGAPAFAILAFGGARVRLGDHGRTSTVLEVGAGGPVRRSPGFDLPPRYGQVGLRLERW